MRKSSHTVLLFRFSLIFTEAEISRELMYRVVGLREILTLRVVSKRVYGTLSVKGQVMRSRVLSIASVAFLTISLTVFPTFVAASNLNTDNPEERTEYLETQINVLLDDVNDELGGRNLRVAKVKKYLTELLDLSSERSQYNIKAAFGRQHRKSGDIESQYADCSKLSNDELIHQLHRLVDNHHSIGYREARTEMFGNLDNFDGYVECIYTGRKLKTNKIPDPSNMNCEHTWPQSQGATGVARTDMHHLFCTDSKSNSIRSSLPFGHVNNSTWSNGGSSRGNGNFEVRKENRGNTARAKFYFAIRYGKRIGSKEESALKQWHNEDPVDDAERARNAGIEETQKNRNPFIDHPEFVGQISDF